MKIQIITEVGSLAQLFMDKQLSIPSISKLSLESVLLSDAYYNTFLLFSGLQQGSMIVEHSKGYGPNATSVTIWVEKSSVCYVFADSPNSKNST